MILFCFYTACALLYIAFLIETRRKRSNLFMFAFMLYMATVGVWLGPSAEGIKWLSYWTNAMIWSMVGGFAWRGQKKWEDE